MFSLLRDEHDFAWAIQEDGRCIVHLKPGTVLNETNIERIIDKLNEPMNEQQTNNQEQNMNEIRNAVIESAEISSSEKGLLDCWLSLDYGGEGQGFGGYALYLPKSFDHHQIMSVAGHHLFRIMEIAGVEKWSQLKGKTIRVEGSWTKIDRIGHIVKDDWYSPSEDFKKATNQ